MIYREALAQSLLDARDDDSGNAMLCEFCKNPIPEGSRRRKYCGEQCKFKAYELRHRDIRIAKKRAVYQSNRQALQQEARAYYWEHRDERVEYARQFRIEHPARFKQIKRKCRAKHRTRLSAEHRVWRLAHPEHMAAYYAKRRALEYGVKVTLVQRLQVAIRDRWLCGLCRRRVKPSEWSLDHIIPLSRGGPHDWSNLQLAHVRCNSAKHNDIVPGQLRLCFEV